MSDLTSDDADEALEKYGPDDFAYALKYAAEHQVDPVWRAALARARAAEGGGGGNPATTGAGGAARGIPAVEIA